MIAKTLLSAAAVALAVTGTGAVSDVDSSECGTRSVRKAWEDLTCEERKAYIDAVRLLKDKEDMYGNFAEMHYENNRQAHGADVFLPWHRWFLWVFEKKLQEVSGNPCITIPYWNWESDFDGMVTIDEDWASGDRGQYTCEGTWAQNPQFCTDERYNQGPNGVTAVDACCACGGGNEVDGKCKSYTVSVTKPHFVPNKHVFNEHAFGDVTTGNSQCVPNGEFSSNFLTRSTDNKKCLQRSFTERWAPSTTEAEVLDMIMNIDDYKEFRRALEGGPHATPHNYVGTIMGTHFSPDDPVFYLHHANIDRIWALWQDYHNYDEDLQSAKNYPTYTRNHEMPFKNKFTDISFFKPNTKDVPTAADMLDMHGELIKVTYGADQLSRLLTDSMKENAQWVTPAAKENDPSDDGTCVSGKMSGPEQAATARPDEEVKAEDEVLEVTMENVLGKAASTFRWFDPFNLLGKRKRSEEATPVSSKKFRFRRLRAMFNSMKKIFDKSDLPETKKTFGREEKAKFVAEVHKEDCASRGGSKKLQAPLSWIKMNNMQDDMDYFACERPVRRPTLTRSPKGTRNLLAGVDEMVGDDENYKQHAE